MTAALLGFALAATLLILAPGPDTMLVVRNSLRGGRTMGLCTSAGTVTGLLIWAGAAALGLSSLVAASRVGYDILRAIGAAYLIWLGVTSLWPHRRGRSNRLSLDNGPTSLRVPSGGLRRAYLNGVISDVCNPKIGAFFVAFLPAFIPTGTSVREFSLALGIWFALETGLWLAVLVWMVQRGVGWLTRPKIHRRLERLTGLVLIAFGIRLATEAR
jgi:threonine/homoserine/homoserine lactone efflux protein